jgi:cytosine/adenosine deaminase-related metal-dependent hydrolase
MKGMAASPSDECSLTARWVFPVDGPPIERGVVSVLGEHISAVEPHGQRTPDIDLGNAAVLPGFVNAHTHLDLTGLRGKCPPSPDFTGWLRQVIAHRRAITPEQTQADIRAGIDECLRFGTTLVGDIASGGASWDVLAEAPLRAVVYYELIGLSKERAATAWEAWQWWHRARPQLPSCRAGISPHAPYSVWWPLFFGAVIAHPTDLPVATHLAETRAELWLLGDRCGPLVDFLKELSAWDPGGLAGGPDDILRLMSARNPVAFAHGNYLRPDAPIPDNGAIVYCPRTHAAFEHPPHPFRDFLARGVRVALGTDSLASNPDLDLLAEARFVHARHPDVPGATLLRMATLAGAEALGWHDTAGSLTPGKSADLVVLPLPDTDSDDPHRLIFESDRAVSAVMFRGRWRERETASGAPLVPARRDS